MNDLSTQEALCSMEFIRHAWENNFKVHVKEVGCDNVDWIQLL